MNQRWWLHYNQLLVTIVAFNSVKLFLTWSIWWVHRHCCCFYPHLKCWVAQMWEQTWWRRNVHRAALYPIDGVLDGYLHDYGVIAAGWWRWCALAYVQNLQSYLGSTSNWLSKTNKKKFLGEWRKNISCSQIARFCQKHIAEKAGNCPEMRKTRAEPLSSTGTVGYFYTLW